MEAQLGKRPVARDLRADYDRLEWVWLAARDYYTDDEHPEDRDWKIAAAKARGRAAEAKRASQGLARELADARREVDQSCIVEITQRLRAAEVDAEEWQREAIEAKERAHLLREALETATEGPLREQEGQAASAPRRWTMRQTLELGVGWLVVNGSISMPEHDEVGAEVLVREDRVTDADVEAVAHALPDLLRYVDGQLFDPHGSACSLLALVLGVSSDGEDHNG
jgi:hypothetical protein